MNGFWLLEKKYVSFFLLGIQLKKKEKKQNKNLLMEPEKINEVLLIFSDCGDSVYTTMKKTALSQF